MSDQQNYPGSYYEPLFDHMSHEHGLTLLEGQMADIIHIVNKMQALHPSESAGVKGLDPDELWDEFSRHIDDDIDSLSTIAGTSVITERDFKELMKRLQTEPPTAAGDGKEDITDHEHEKEVMMQAFDKVRQLFEGRSWIMEGRGSYPYDDDRYKEEVRYMYDEFDALFKDTWANIKSKSFEYRSKIIEQYKKDSGKEDAVAFVDWGHDNVKGYDPIAEKWIYGDNEERYTTSQLYDIYKQSK